MHAPLKIEINPGCWAVSSVIPMKIPWVYGGGGIWSKIWQKNGNPSQTFLQVLLTAQHCLSKYWPQASKSSH